MRGRDVPSAVSRILREKAESIGDSPFLRFGEGVVTFGWMDERSNRAANLLREIGVRRGDKVCLMTANRPEFVELWFGIAKLGAIMVPLEPSLEPDSVSYVASHSDATVFAVEGSACPSIEDRLRKSPQIRKKLWIGEAGASPPGFLDYRETVGAFSAAARFPATDPSDVMSIVYTPGTSGLPKGAMLSQRNYLHSGRVWSENVVRPGENDVFYTALPLARIQTQTLMVVGALIGGRPIVLADGFDARTFFNEIRRSGATVFDYAGSMIDRLLALEPSPEDASNPARLAFGGAISGFVRRAFESRFAVEVAEGFHLVECGGMCIANSGERAKEGAIGRPLPSYEVKIVDEFGEELPTGLSGEIVLRPRVREATFPGYYREHDRTAEYMPNGWFHTGDRGYVDTEGDFYFLDRKADCIRHGGEMFPCVDIERVVNSHPEVLESAATGVLAELDDEIVRLFLVLRPGGTLSGEAVIAWCKERMPPHLVPRFVEIVPGLPKTVAGSIRRFELRKRPVPEQRVPPL